MTAAVIYWVKDNTAFSEGSPGTETLPAPDRTNFYAEQGGQVGDIGRITADGITFVVEDTAPRLEHPAFGVLTDGPSGWSVGRDSVTTEHGPQSYGHPPAQSAREVLGPHVEQGIAVDAEKRDSTSATISRLRRRSAGEEMVNQQILRDLPVTPVTMPLVDRRSSRSGQCSARST